MDKNLNFRADYPAIFLEQESMTENGRSCLTDEEKLISCEGRVFIPKNGFWKNVKAFSLFLVLKSYTARWRYIAALWLTREIAIITILRENFEKVPKGTISKVIARPWFSSVIVKILSFVKEILFPLGSIQKISVVPKTDSKQ